MLRLHTLAHRILRRIVAVHSAVEPQLVRSLQEHNRVRQVVEKGLLKEYCRFHYHKRSLPFPVIPPADEIVIHHWVNDLLHQGEL